jgi:hypothetical protein
VARDRVVIDLRTLGPQVRKHCEDRGTTISKLVLPLLATAVGADPPSHQAPPPKDRSGRRKLSVLLGSDAYRALEKPAGEAGLTVAAFVARLATERAGKPLPPAPTALETSALVQSNYELRALGRNLNQIARSLNAYPGKVTASERNELASLAAHIDAHVRKSASVLLALNPPRSKRTRTAE